MIIDGLLLAALVPVAVCASYLFVLALAARVPAAALPRRSTPFFTIIVPAHDEAANIAATVRSLQQLEYPRDRFEILVVADNCRDGTAEIARAAGARVLERVDASRRGKGYALAFAFENVLAAAQTDAVVVVDADTSVSQNLLDAFACRFEAGAHAVQGHYTVRNPDATWRTRLMTIALALFHGVRSLARERLRLSAGLRGNGMAFSRSALATVPHDAFSIVEDLEYGIKLGRAGHRVHYAHDAEVFADMVPGERDSRSQRHRWEAGRRALARSAGPDLIQQAVSERSLMLLDLAMDVLVPPLASLVVAATAGTAATLTATLWLGRPPLLVVPWLIVDGMLVSYVLRGVAMSGLGARGLLYLSWAPVYVAWKLALRLRGGGNTQQWVRTARDAGSNDADPRR
jgi:cellulose synthase/poly-beta-1,6-N-acetylglucosamine synthase-like glycosyltransferase